MMTRTRSTPTPHSIWAKWNIAPARFALCWCALSLLWACVLWLTQTPLPWAGACFWAGSVCLAASIVDWRSHILPDVFTLYGGALAVLACAAARMWSGLEALGQGGVPDGWQEPVWGALCGFLVLKGLQLALRQKHSGQEQLGSGDAKLMLALGAMTGPLGVLPSVFIALGLVFILSRIRKTAHLPFGPALTLAGLLVTVAGWHWP